MFAGSYQMKDSQLHLSKLGVIGSVATFLMLTLMIQWPLLQTEAEFSPFSQLMLWGAPILLSLFFSAAYFAIARWQSTNKKTGYSYGVTYHWTVASLLPVAAIVSLAEYFALEAFSTALVHAAGLIFSLGIYGLLLISRRAMHKHSRVLLFSYGFYALAAAVQLVLFML